MVKLLEGHKGSSPHCLAHSFLLWVLPSPPSLSLTSGLSWLWAQSCGGGEARAEGSSSSPGVEACGDSSAPARAGRAQGAGLTRRAGAHRGLSHFCVQPWPGHLFLAGNWGKGVCLHSAC